MKQPSFNFVVVIATLLSPLVPLLTCHAQNDTDWASQFPFVQVHGSGTSNPARCFWHVLEEMQVQSKIPTKLTYRSTASGNGISDFIGNITTPNNDFASGDIPFTAENYKLLTDAGVEMLHLPVLLGAVGVFHTVPVKTGHTLNMTACLLARIFNGEITDWYDSEIMDINPNHDIPLKYDNYGNLADDQSYPITASRRFLGSSSTFVLTAYLNKVCPENWPEDKVGSVIEWPEEFQVCQGTAQMVACIQDVEGSIGYLDVGTAYDEGLQEAALRVESVNFRNGDLYLDSRNSISKGGLLPALESESATIPNSTLADWSSVDLINQVDGYVYTWPMVILTYIYVRRDLTEFIPDPRAQSLLVTFLKNLYDEHYMSICESRYQFTLVTGEIQEMALEGINSIIVDEDAPEWLVETDSVLGKGIGQGDYVISNRRQSSTFVEQEILMEALTEAEAEVEVLTLELESLQEELMAMNETVTELQASQIELQTAEEFSGDDRDRLNSSFVMSIVAITLWAVAFAFMCFLQVQINGLDRDEIPMESPVAPKRTSSR
eukprot:Nitzschia sp. Nitz4//scaffold216_size36101//28990//30714//NITZ4_007785-RA/size36101-snap-gene-0.19-mRNA-1//-1//CDS//3329542206//3972//frame0